MTRAIVAALLGWAVLAPAARALDVRETAALREAAWNVNGTLLDLQGDAALLAEAGQADPGLPQESRDHVAEALRSDTALRRRLADVLRVRLYWRSRPGQHLVFWWDPDQRDAAGLPSRAPTRDEVEDLDAVAQEIAERFGLPIPKLAPYRVDLESDSPRVFPRDDLRWGVVSPSPSDRASVAELVLRDAGDLPWLVRALALLHGECRGDEARRADLLDRAREVVVESGYVDVDEGLGAGVLSSIEDPALASALLAVDHLERRVAPAAFVELLRAAKPDDPRLLRRTFARELGESPRQVDREVLRALELAVGQRRERERLEAADEAREAAGREPSR